MAFNCIGEPPWLHYSYYHAIAQHAIAFSQDMAHAIWLLARSITLGELTMAEACGQLEILIMAHRKQARMLT